MSSFASDLSARMISHPEFREAIGDLQSAGAANTLPENIERSKIDPDLEALGKLLYCASVFAQSKIEAHITLAQAIAFNAMLVSQEPSVLERCSAVLTELGNFPGLKYSQLHFNSKLTSLVNLIQRHVIEHLNTIQVHGDKIALTDYQKEVWDSLQEGRSVAISAPTSAGKSFLVIEHLCRRAAVEESFTFVYIAPTRALLSEVHLKIKERLASDAEIRITDIPTFEQNPRQVFVLTQERFQVLLSTTSSVIDLVVVDEAQNLSDGARGMILQSCIEQCFERSASTSVVMLAPGAEGFKEALTSLGLPEISEITTTVSPVLQNRIVVTKSVGANELEFKLLASHQATSIGSMKCNVGLASPDSRFAAVAIELGSKGGSLVYAKTPTEAAKLAGSIALGVTSPDAIGKNDDLVSFIKDHIHPDYHLIGMVEKGVAFHYGQMPSLLREAIETAFRKGSIKFLVCTTTLFQGINLPARNVFIDTPARGKGDRQKLDPALLWNFAGRAGRMSKDIVGNVFLVDYESWSEQPMDRFKKFTIKSALSDVITHNARDVLNVLGGKAPPGKPRDEVHRNAVASAGMLISKARQGCVQAFLDRVAPELDIMDSRLLSNASEKASSELLLPLNVLNANWTLDLFALNALMTFLIESVKSGDVEQLIPKSPGDLGKHAFGHYRDIFNNLFKFIKGFGGNFGAYVARIAVRWMEGKPYPVILRYEINAKQAEIQRKRDIESMYVRTVPNYKAKSIAALNPSKVIKDAFDTIEDVIRFQLVQMGKAYIDILTSVLIENGLSHKVSEIFDFSLALELGVSTTTGRAFLELGLSRIAAAELQRVVPNSDLDVAAARKVIMEYDQSTFSLSQVIVDEIKRVRDAISSVPVTAG
jgi:superfamily II DNA/RNA helicase